MTQTFKMASVKTVTRNEDPLELLGNKAGRRRIYYYMDDSRPAIAKQANEGPLELLRRGSTVKIARIDQMDLLATKAGAIARSTKSAIRPGNRAWFASVNAGKQANTLLGYSGTFRQLRA